MAEVAAFLFALATLIGAKPVVEQPAGSMMWSFKPLAQVIEEFKAKSVTCTRCVFTPEVPYGERYLKRYKFLGADWVKDLHVQCACPRNEHKPLARVDNNGAVTGDKNALRESQAYPARLGHFVVSRCFGFCNETSPLSGNWKRPKSSSEEMGSETKKCKKETSWKTLAV